MPSLGHVTAATVSRAGEPPATAWSRNEMPRHSARHSERRGLLAVIRSRTWLRVTDAPPTQIVPDIARAARRPVMQIVPTHGQHTT